MRAPAGMLFFDKKPALRCRRATPVVRTGLPSSGQGGRAGAWRGSQGEPISFFYCHRRLASLALARLQAEPGATA